MNYVYIFIVIAAVLITAGVLLYFFQRKTEKVSQSNQPKKPVDSVVSKSKIIEANKTPTVSPQLTALKRELMTMVLHNQRVYQNNIEIARRDFSRRNIPNPSETDLIERAIEIWRDDNR